MPSDELDRLLAELRHVGERLTEVCLRLREEAIRDPLTGVYNRRLLRLRLDEETARARRYAERFSLLFLDLDGFKEYNDRHGHPAGDRLLVELTAVWRSSLRDPDELFRYGGDEFVVLLPRSGSREAVHAAQRLLGLTQRVGRGLSVSIGIAAFPENGGSADELLQAADRVLYRAKRERHAAAPVRHASSAAEGTAGPSDPPPEEAVPGT